MPWPLLSVCQHIYFCCSSRFDASIHHARNSSKMHIYSIVFYYLFMLVHNVHSFHMTKKIVHHTSIWNWNDRRWWTKWQAEERQKIHDSFDKMWMLNTCFYRQLKSEWAYLITHGHINSIDPVLIEWNLTSSTGLINAVKTSEKERPRAQRNRERQGNENQSNAYITRTATSSKWMKSVKPKLCWRPKWIRKWEVSKSSTLPELLWLV